MKKITRVLLIALLINLLTSFAYAGMMDAPRPTSTEPIATDQQILY